MGGKAPKASSAPAPIPSSPTRWLYDRNGSSSVLQEYGHYERNGNGGFTLVQDNKPLDQGLYLSPQEAEKANPKVWIYDNQGKAVQQIFKGGAGPDDSYDTTKYNLGPDSVPYRHWYDIYGVSQKYAPVDTPMEAGYYDSPNKAPKSASYQAPTSYDSVDPGMNVQPDGSPSADLAATKQQAKKRRITGQTKQLTLLGDNSSMGSGDGKTLLGE